MKNTIRQLSLPGYDTGDYIAESIAFLRENEPPEGFYVGFSGGKDSIVSLELCRIAGVKHQAFYSCTRIDPPEVVRFIKKNYPDAIWLYPKMTMWEAIQKKAPPLRMQRWCCDVLKKEPSDNHPLRKRVMGIRAEESVRRASRPRLIAFEKQTYTSRFLHGQNGPYGNLLRVWAYRIPHYTMRGSHVSAVSCVLLFLAKLRGPHDNATNQCDVGRGYGKHMNMR